MDVKKKRVRTENWTAEDKELLQQLVREKVKTVENKNTDTNTNKLKNEAWNAIEESFNMMGSAKRSGTQLKGQWSVLKMNAKKENTSAKQAVFKTGGGPGVVQKEIAVDDIRAWLPQEFEVDINEFDSDQVQIDESIIFLEPTTDNDETATVIQKLDVPIDVPPPRLSSQNSDNETVEKQHSVKAKKNKRRAEKSSTKESISAIAETETKCRLELHQIQMATEKKKADLFELQIETERKRAMNADLENDILREKLKMLKERNLKCNMRLSKDV